MVVLSAEYSEPLVEDFLLLSVAAFLPDVGFLSERKHGYGASGCNMAAAADLMSPRSTHTLSLERV
jgi:hypothetical protein